MRASLIALALALGSPALAERSTISIELGQSGLKPTEARLAALPAPTEQELFALAGIRFLSAVERALQLRWQTGIRADWSELPILRLPIPENPDARPFAPEDLVTLLGDIDAGMDQSRAALATLGDRPFTLDIALSDLWFDINANSRRDAGEDVADVAGLTLGAGRIGTVEVIDPVIQFDGSDAAWLSAYTHFLSGFATLALAYDPAPAIQRVIDSSDQIYALWGDTPPPNALDMMFGRQVDRVAMVLHALSATPDAALTRKAHGHLLSMITENRRFWALVNAETDAAAEWVPNENQRSALGILMPPGTADRWQAVLADAEKLLTGDLLIPHWRFGAEAGINLREMFENPVPVDLITWVQGEGLLPFAEKGTRASPFAWNEFTRIVEGDAMLFALFLN
ncbi:MAG: hypothetical protein HC844_02435 [Tabrizicola sp.]|nr:hypothetical protein [Tabrizicola sp.]